MDIRQVALVALAGIACITGALTRDVPVRAAERGPAFRVSASVAPGAVALGATTNITATITGDTDVAALVNIEVRIPAGEKVYQEYFDDQSLSAGRAAEFHAAWQVPGDAVLGAYIVLVGVFSPGWDTQYFWTDDAGEFVVTSAGGAHADMDALLAPSRRMPFPFPTLGPGTDLPDGDECAAAVRRSTWEPRPANADANHMTPADVALPAWEGVEPEANDRFVARINGNFTGTTDEILQWGACKWGFDVNIVRAVAVKESSWRQSAVGDGGRSFGILQVKYTAHPGTHPWSEQSTAFNVDYALAWRRACFEGYFTWLPPDAIGDEWGCIGLWSSGEWQDAAGLDYVADVKRFLRQKAWLDPRF